jgi:hypothetical protein
MVNGLDGAVGLHVPFPVEVVLATREGPVIRLLLNMAEHTVPVAFVGPCLSFCTFSIGHFVVCPSSIYGL